MSGHSKWATIKRKKGALDAKRGAIFTKCIKEITIAARHGGGDPDANPRLRLAIEKAKANNMPSKNIENAIMRGTGQMPGVVYEETTYEAYAPGGVAMLIEVASDNKNRTVAEIRHLITKNNGNMANAGAVAWMFQSKGRLEVDAKAVDEDKLMETVLDAGADDMTLDDGLFEVTSKPENLEKVKKALEQHKIPYTNAEVAKIAQNSVKVTGETANKVLKLVEALEEHEDVQQVFANFDIDSKELEKLSVA